MAEYFNLFFSDNQYILFERLMGENSSILLTENTLYEDIPLSPLHFSPYTLSHNISKNRILEFSLAIPKIFF